MPDKVFCPVCLVSFMHKDRIITGQELICPVCGAKLEIASVSPQIVARRFPQEPEAEIRERVDTYARLKGYTFNEDKEIVVDGLIEKYEKFGDFYCPCRLENTPENICPCLETRRGQVRREGRCY